MMPILAEIMISGEWITTITVAIIGAIGAVWLKGRSSGKREEAERRVTIDGQPLSFTNCSPNVTHLEMSELKRDMDLRFTKIEAALSEERTIARVALGKIHARLDSGAVAVAEMKGGMESISNNVDRILAIMMTPNNQRPPRS